MKMWSQICLAQHSSNHPPDQRAFGKHHQVNAMSGYRLSKIESNGGGYRLGDLHSRLPVRKSTYGSSRGSPRPERCQGESGATAAQGPVAGRADDGEDGVGRRRDRRLDDQPDGSTGGARVEDRRRARDARLALPARSVCRAGRCLGAALPDGRLFRERTRQGQARAGECTGSRGVPNIRGPSRRSCRVGHDVRRRVEAFATSSGSGQPAIPLPERSPPGSPSSASTSRTSSRTR